MKRILRKKMAYKLCVRKHNELNSPSPVRPHRRYATHHTVHGLEDNAPKCNLSDATTDYRKDVVTLTAWWSQWLDSKFWSEHNLPTRLGEGYDWRFTLRLPLALEHHWYLDLLMCRSPVDKELQLAKLGGLQDGGLSFNLGTVVYYLDL